MNTKYLFSFLVVVGLFSCDLNSANDKKGRAKVEKINKQRCSFDLSADLHLEKIDSKFDEEGYFLIGSYKSSNILQLFVYDSQVDVEQNLDDQLKALNSPDVFKAKSIDSLNQFGIYNGKGIIMNGNYVGGVVKGTIKIFSYGKDEKGFLVIRQNVENTDSKNFDLIENSFLLK